MIIRASIPTILTLGNLTILVTKSQSLLNCKTNLSMIYLTTSRLNYNNWWLRSLLSLFILILISALFPWRRSWPVWLIINNIVRQSDLFLLKSWFERWLIWWYQLFLRGSVLLRCWRYIRNVVNKFTLLTFTEEPMLNF